MNQNSILLGEVRQLIPNALSFTRKAEMFAVTGEQKLEFLRLYQLQMMDAVDLLSKAIHDHYQTLPEGVIELFVDVEGELTFCLSPGVRYATEDDLIRLRDEISPDIFPGTEGIEYWKIEGKLLSVRYCVREDGFEFSWNAVG